MECHNERNMKHPLLTPKIRIPGVKYHTHEFPMSIIDRSFLAGGGISIAVPEQKLQNG